MDVYAVRSGRLLVEEIDYNRLFRGFVGLKLDDQQPASAPSPARFAR